MAHDFLNNKTDIEHWLNDNNISCCFLRPDTKYGYVVDVDFHVNLSGRSLSHIPVKFGVVQGNFDCSNNNLTSLEGSPEKVYGFFCGQNQLTSLQYCPQSIEGDFDCKYNQLTTLKFCPQKIDGSFDCSYNQLTSLEFSPKEIPGNFSCASNALTSLQYCPQSIIGCFMAYKNKISSLEFFPGFVSSFVDCEYNDLPESVQHTRNFSTLYKIHKEIHQAIADVKKEKKILARSILPVVIPNNDSQPRAFKL